MNEYSRRQVIRAGMDAALALFTARFLVREAQAAWADPTTSPQVSAAAAPDAFHLGASRRPDGRTLTVDSRSLLLDGIPWLPTSGEFHYARYPADEWPAELLKMKAGGVDIVSTYVFWIHHEEIENAWDWSGRRSLRAFVVACQAAGLSMIVRIGPWCHGEVRNGGFPGWLLTKGYKLRSDDPGYLTEVKRLYSQIADQMHGLLWKDGGPIAGIQVENEFGGPQQHLLTLKRIAIDAGINVPIYTKTGWSGGFQPKPFGELLPLSGGYVDGFWDRELTAMPRRYGDDFRFQLVRGAGAAAMGAAQLAPQTADNAANTGSYPYLCCEIGGGMETSYHRRIRIAPADIESGALVKLGSGNNLQGYYMYHGGTNPDGKLTTLQESQATNYWNDLPIKTYDFYAPLGEFGQIHPHYHGLRRMALFQREWGSILAPMPAWLSPSSPTSATDTQTLRWAARTDGRAGFVFVNNYQRLQEMPAKQNVLFEIPLTDGSLVFPQTPITVPADTYFCWPFNMDLAGANLRYATAQPICRLDEGDTTYLVFGETPGIAAEFFIDTDVTRLEGRTGTISHEAGRYRIHDLRPGPGSAFQVSNGKGTAVVILLGDAQSRACWKGALAGRDRIFLSTAGLSFDGSSIHVETDSATDPVVSVFPAPRSLEAAGAAVHAATDGLFRRFRLAAHRPAEVKAALTSVSAAAPARKVPIGSQGVAEAPTDSDFDQAAIWRITLPKNVSATRDLLLRIHYRGDVARLYLGDRLLDDNFYSGQAFELGLKRYAPDIYGEPLLLKVLPLRADAPIYFSDTTLRHASDPDTLVEVSAVEVAERHTMTATVA